METTCSLAGHEVGSHFVSEPDDASSPSAFVVPPGQVVQTWEETYSSAEHKMASHDVFPSLIISPALRFIPGGHSLQSSAET